MASKGDGFSRWGDEVFVPSDAIASLPVLKVASSDEHVAGLRVRRTDEMMLLLAPTTGACVALTDDEAQPVHSFRGGPAVAASV